MPFCFDPCSSYLPLWRTHAPGKQNCPFLRNEFVLTLTLAMLRHRFDDCARDCSRWHWGCCVMGTVCCGRTIDRCELAISGQGGIGYSRWTSVMARVWVRWCALRLGWRWFAIAVHVLLESAFDERWRTIAFPTIDGIRHASLHQLSISSYG